MNLLDFAIGLIIVFSIYSGVLQGFILSFTSLLGSVASLLLCFLLFSPVSIFVDKYITDGFWSIPLALIFTLILIRFLVSAVLDRLVAAIPLRYHGSAVNRTLGVLPGALNGVIYSAIVSVALFILPLGDKVSSQVYGSRLANIFNERFQYIQEKYLPELENTFGKPLTKITIEPGDNKFIKLPFKTQNFKERKDLEAEMLNLLNRERRKLGLRPLKADPEMRIVALKHSADMFSRGYFSHFTPEQKTPFDRMEASRVRFITAGENLALAPTLLTAHEGLMNSPGHRANILQPAFGRVGIGILDGGFHGLMITQNFRN